MKKLVYAASAAEAISEKYNIPLEELIDVFARIPPADVDAGAELPIKNISLMSHAIGTIEGVAMVSDDKTTNEYEIALFHFLREQLFVRGGFRLVMSDEEIDARTLDAMDKLRAKAESPRMRGQYLRAVRDSGKGHF